MRFVVDNQYQGMRIDLYLLSNLKKHIEISRNQIDNVLKDFVRLNLKPVKKGVKLKEGYIIDIDIDSIKARLAQINDNEIIPVKGDLNIIEETKDYIVINKQHGIAVHPGKGNEKNTVANYLRYYLEQKGEYDLNIKRGGIVHRLDKVVGGILICAKNLKTQRILQEQFETRKVVKLYLAKVVSLTKTLRSSSINLKSAIADFKNNGYKATDDWIKVEGKIGRSKSDRRKMVIGNSGRECKSYVLPLEDNYVLVQIVTGRMHQVRATVSNLGWVIEGDTLYGFRSNPRDRIELTSIFLGIMVESDWKEWIIGI